MKKRVTVDGRDHTVTYNGKRIVEIRYAIPDYHRLSLPPDHPDKLWPQTFLGHRGGPREGKHFKS